MPVALQNRDKPQLVNHKGPRLKPYHSTAAFGSSRGTSKWVDIDILS